MFFFALIVISHILFISYWAISFVREFRFTIRQMFPSVYVAVFLCCKKRHLDRELKLEAFKKSKIYPFITSIDHVMDCKLNYYFTCYLKYLQIINKLKMIMVSL